MRLDDIDYLKIGKWVLVVLVAGFVGQFGKSLATQILSRVRRGKGRSAQHSESALVPPSTKSLMSEAPRSQSKPQPETGGGEEASSNDGRPTGITKDEAKRLKKTLKSLAKQKKKEGK